MKKKATYTSSFSDAELNVIAKYASKISLDTMLILVNAVSKVVRNKKALRGKCNRLGYSVRVKL